ncbi:hypothetical protein ACBJ59_36775 [Nonomuraea sp. MTCD27]|uniref:hypothetical protein n=1 Tax=Nonomuraea sp. MTCD27 TaxID=1676747 RepID=UPI0035BF6748
MSALLCLACGAPVEEKANGRWEGQDGSTDCPRRDDGHLVEQVVPDPPEDQQAALRDMVDYHAPNMKAWKWQIEFDADGGWWLTENGRRRRRNRRPWRPTSEPEAFIVITLLYVLNDAGPVPLPEEYAAALVRHRRSVESERKAFEKYAMSWFYKHMMR